MTLTVSPGSRRVLSSPHIEICVYSLLNRLFWKQDKERDSSVDKLLEVFSRPCRSFCGNSCWWAKEVRNGCPSAASHVNTVLPPFLGSKYLYPLQPDYDFPVCLETQQTDLLKSQPLHSTGRPQRTHSPRTRRGFCSCDLLGPTQAELGSHWLPACSLSLCAYRGTVTKRLRGHSIGLPSPPCWLTAGLTSAAHP